MEYTTEDFEREEVEERYEGNITRLNFAGAFSGILSFLPAFSVAYNAFGEQHLSGIQEITRSCVALGLGCASAYLLDRANRMSRTFRRSPQDYMDKYHPEISQEREEQTNPEVETLDGRLS